MSVDALAVLKNLGISTDRSVHYGIQRVTEVLDSASSRLNAANRIIMQLGCQPQKEEKYAELVAKALIEQAYLTGRQYNPEAAIQVAQEKYQRILKNMPYIFIRTEDTPVATTDEGEARIVKTRAKKGGDNDKRQAVYELYKQYLGKMNNNQLAKKIAEELDLSPANVSYYINRVFSKEK